jgi:hypothetical protein
MFRPKPMEMHAWLVLSLVWEEECASEAKVAKWPAMNSPALSFLSCWQACKSDGLRQFRR